MSFEGSLSLAHQEQRIARDQLSPEQRAGVDTQRRKQEALAALTQTEQRYAEAREALSEYQLQAFDAWRDWGFRDPSTFFVYHDGTNGYHVNDYFLEDPGQLVRLRQLARDLEDAQSTYTAASDALSADSVKGGASVRPEQVYAYRMPDLPGVSPETKAQPSFEGGVQQFARGYQEAAANTQAHFARVEALFNTPFQMPIPGEGARATVDAWLDQPVVGAYEPMQNRAVEALQSPEPIAPGAAFAGPEDPTEQIQVPTIPTIPVNAKQPLYKRVLSSLFQ
jgi:hypothetical protein